MEESKDKEVFSVKNMDQEEFAKSMSDKNVVIIRREITQQTLLKLLEIVGPNGDEWVINFSDGAGIKDAARVP